MCGCKARIYGDKVLPKPATVEVGQLWSAKESDGRWYLWRVVEVRDGYASIRCGNWRGQYTVSCLIKAPEWHYRGVGIPEEAPWGHTHAPAKPAERPPTCGALNVGDEGEHYHCGLLAGHLGDHVDEYGLAGWANGLAPLRRPDHDKLSDVIRREVRAVLKELLT
jgi:hypothetical protein